MPWPKKRRVVGTRVQRLDGSDKATGRAKYSYDINRPGMLHARILRCPHARAIVTSIDTKAAEKMPGFRAIHRLVQVKHQCTWAGEEILAIACDTEEHAEDAIRAVRIEYQVEKLPFMVKEEDALRGEQVGTVLGLKGTVVPSNITLGGTFETANFAGQAFEGTAASPSGTRSSKTSRSGPRPRRCR
jgi:CO/xanthine dehydrogenase Mo-binding subunit